MYAIFSHFPKTVLIDAANQVYDRKERGWANPVEFALAFASKGSPTLFHAALDDRDVAKCAQAIVKFEHPDYRESYMYANTYDEYREFLKDWNSHDWTDEEIREAMGLLEPTEKQPSLTKTQLFEAIEEVVFDVYIDKVLRKDVGSLVLTVLYANLIDLDEQANDKAPTH